MGIEGSVHGAWPSNGLEIVAQCPVCGSDRRSPLHARMLDRVFRIAPGVWDLHGCRDCGSAWIDPRPSTETLHLAYNGYFTHEPSGQRTIIRRTGVIRRFLHDAVNGYMEGKYGVKRSPARAGWLLHLMPPLRAECDEVCRHLPKPVQGASLLDVGCGNGTFLELAREMGWQAEGVDFDEAAVRQARSLGFHVTHGGVEALSARANTFDAVTSSHVVEHVPDPVGHLREIWRLLKPGGLLWVQTPNIESLGFRRYGRDWRGLEPPRHLVLFNNASLERSLTVAGFEDIRTLAAGAQVFPVFRASEALKIGAPVAESGGNKSRLAFELCAGLIEWLRPNSREFITVMCRKAGV